MQQKTHELTPTPLCRAKRGYETAFPLLLLAREGGRGMSTFEKEEPF